jgi:hypothetical protein
MRRNRQSLLRLGVSLLGLLSLSPSLLAQASSNVSAKAPLPTDWSHRHLIFSRPATKERARRVEKDPRYWQQQARRPPRRSTQAGSAADLRLHFGPPPTVLENPASGRRRKFRRDWSEDLGTGATVGAGNFPAKFSFSPTTANCATAAQPDFVVYGTGLFGTGIQASIVAYDNLYSGCTGTVPTVYWAYDTVGTILSSPVFSIDGSQVAFIQTNGAPTPASSLVLLKWAASVTDTVGAPTVLTRVIRADYPTCIAPCLTTDTLRDSGNNFQSDTNSSVFYDYDADTAYVGDDSGLLHKFTPVFNGVPAEVIVGWPVQVNPGNSTPLGSPVHDPVTGNVFVGDTGGFLYRVDASGIVTTSGALDISGFVQGPIVDATAGLVYVFAANDGSAGCGGTGCSAVYELSTTFASGSQGPPPAELGTSAISQPIPLYPGDFDSTYENSTNATGNLYVCGNTGGTPILYQVALNAGALGTATAGPVISNQVFPCSPVTDILNPNAAGGPTEWLYVSAQTQGVPSVCVNLGCLMNFKNTPWLAATAYSVGQEILDNKFHIQAATVTGTSGTTQPTWTTSVGALVTDGTVTWINQGLVSATTPGAWAAGHPYIINTRILDSNNNIQIVSTAGTSGGTVPIWSTVPGATTIGGAVLRWKNLGAISTFALPSAGGTSGIIVDNTVGSGTLAGASQVYFSTLADQLCFTSTGTGGCAVQASQSALQ